ncbi:DUF3945 domain-containing protein [Dysgonomonas sp. Marseille-P4677]|uniref:DUF3945 domain-containing protein n=1 Tax=Dysgonomonas sp. Marseille-P4677 TaxID=2364790 RepID=UPI001F19FDC9|nr:DUF3945 domain-containing protein [Dysgonomonas sp. Marseille-P4677]
MVQLAKEYMQEMGINNTQYIIVKHHNPDKVKYYIYDTVKAALPRCKNEKDLQLLLQKAGIETEFKLKRTTGEVEGISFRYDGIAFKGSQIDRKFSFGNLRKEFERNIEVRQEQAVRDKQRQEKQPGKAQQLTGSKPKTCIIGGVKLTLQQWQTLEDGRFIYLENMKKKDGGGEFSSYVFLNDEKKKAFPSDKNPDEFVKYGKYEMRIRDKILIEHDCITKAKVKWWGGIDYKYPYLWKEDKSYTEYKES